MLDACGDWLSKSIFVHLPDANGYRQSHKCNAQCVFGLRRNGKCLFGNRNAVRSLKFLMNDSSIRTASIELSLGVHRYLPEPNQTQPSRANESEVDWKMVLPCLVTDVYPRHFHPLFDFSASGGGWWRCCDCSKCDCHWIRIPDFPHLSLISTHTHTEWYTKWGERKRKYFRFESFSPRMIPPMEWRERESEL